MEPMKDLIKTALRHIDTEDLVKELNDRFDKVEMSGLKYRMDRQIEHEARVSALSVDEIKSELAKYWLQEV